MHADNILALVEYGGTAATLFGIAKVAEFALLAKFVRDHIAPARPFQGHDLRLLRRGMLLQGGDAGRPPRAHGPLQARRGQ